VEDRERNMDSQVQTPKFDVGHRVKVVLLREDGEPMDHLSAYYLKYHGKVGYVAESEVELPKINHERWKTLSYNYQIFMVKIGIILRLPEKYLESAESRRFVV
jgi:hypothetical protein